MRNTKQIEPNIPIRDSAEWSGYGEDWTDLSRYVCNGSKSDLNHAVQACISRSRRLCFVLHGAGRCEDKLVSLVDAVSDKGRIKNNVTPPRWVFYFVIILSMDPPRHRDNHGTEIVASCLQRQYTLHCGGALEFWKTFISSVSIKENSTDSSLSQLKPAGQSKKPVRGWWNPRLVLTLRASGGSSGSPGSIIQSTTAVFRPFVSSDLDIEAPLCI